MIIIVYFLKKSGAALGLAGGFVARRQPHGLGGARRKTRRGSPLPPTENQNPPREGVLSSQP